MMQLYRPHDLPFRIEGDFDYRYFAKDYHALHEWDRSSVPYVHYPTDDIRDVDWERGAIVFHNRDIYFGAGSGWLKMLADRFVTFQVWGQDGMGLVTQHRARDKILIRVGDILLPAPYGSNYCGKPTRDDERIFHVDDLTTIELENMTDEQYQTATMLRLAD